MFLYPEDSFILGCALYQELLYSQNGVLVR